MTVRFFARGVASGVAVLLALAVVGCEQQPSSFAPNLVFARRQKLAKDVAGLRAPAVAEQLSDIDRLVTLAFGTSDEPCTPDSTQFNWSQLLELRQLQMAAGPIVITADGVQTGLFRRYCARCHGVTGDGRGWLAPLLDPYPHDFRRGIFKFKSTPSTIPPTRADLQAVVDRGIPGTGMPAFGHLPIEQQHALVEYVRYLSIRGLFERELIAIVAMEFDEGERLVTWRLEKQHPDRYQEELQSWWDVADEIGQKWLTAPAKATPVPAPDPDWESPVSIARGRQLFFSTLTNCAQCHGNTALGDGQTEDYDEWAKELDPTNPRVLADYLELGALPPRTVRPRNLREGIFRGGDGLDDVFRLVKNGIAGTTMPSIATELSDAEIWSLVAFVRHLPKDPINHK